MKVLSDWQPGTPPMPGMWLVRIIADRRWSCGELTMWDGDDWRLTDGTCITFGNTPIEYRGLAFDPEEAVPHYLTPEGEDWIVWVPN